MGADARVSYTPSVLCDLWKSGNWTMQRGSYPEHVHWRVGSTAKQRPSILNRTATTALDHAVANNNAVLSVARIVEYSVQYVNPCVVSDVILIAQRLPSPPLALLSMISGHANMVLQGLCAEIRDHW